jgi:hypothetical protein
MPSVRVTVSDQSSGKTVTAELPNNATMDRLLPALVTKMGLLPNAQYVVYHNEANRKLGANETLKQANVENAHTLTLLRESNNTQPGDPVSPVGKVTVTVTDQAGGKTVVAELPTGASMSRLVPALITKMMLPSNVRYGIQHKQSGRLLQPNETLQSAGVRSGDTLRLLPDVTAGGGIPVRSFRDIQLVEAVLTHDKLIKNMQSAPILFAIFLYTEEDENLAWYIRQHVRELHQMTGNQCWFFTIERPTKEWNLDIRCSLGELAEEYFNALWERLGVDNFKPFEKTQAYHIGERLGVTPKQFPCVAFFSGLRTRELVIVEINDFVDASLENVEEEYTRFFRILFSVSRQVTTDSKEKWLSKFEKQLRKEWKDATRQEIKPIGSVEIATSLIETLGTIIASFFAS